MSYRVHGKDLLTLHEVSLLCEEAAQLGITTDQLGRLYLSEPTDDDALRDELEQISAVGGQGAVVAEKALTAWADG